MPDFQGLWFSVVAKTCIALLVPFDPDEVGQGFGFFVLVGGDGLIE